MMFKRTIFGKQIRSVIVKSILKGRLIWLWRYLFLQRTPERYSSFFLPKAGQLAGEITPAYARLPEKVIADFARINPNCRLIYILRNPVERTWSHMNMIKKRKESQLKTDQPIIAQIKFRQRKESAYLRNLARWEKYFEPAQIYIGFYDDLKANPESFLKKIYAFLRVKDHFNESLGGLNQVVNKGKYSGIPESVERELTQYHYDDLLGLNQKFNNEYTAKWLKRAEDILKKDELH